MKPEHAEEYTQALGQVVSGGWRQAALAEKLGVPKALGLTTREWIEQRLGGYVRLAVEERHGAVKELKDEGFPNTKIAEVLGVDEKTVRNDSEKSEPKELKAAETSADDSENSELNGSANGNGLPEADAERLREHEEGEGRRRLQLYLDEALSYLEWDGDVDERAQYLAERVIDTKKLRPDRWRSAARVADSVADLLEGVRA